MKARILTAEQREKANPMYGHLRSDHLQGFDQWLQNHPLGFVGELINPYEMYEAEWNNWIIDHPNKIVYINNQEVYKIDRNFAEDHEIDPDDCFKFPLGSLQDVEFVEKPKLEDYRGPDPNNIESRDREHYETYNGQLVNVI